jgi:hypothetical protein
MGNQVITQKKKDMFLAQLRLSGHVTNSAQAVGYADATYLRKLRAKDADFAQEWEEAMVAAVEDILEPEAMRRAVNGVQEPVFHKGDVVGYKTRYSDQLMMFLLKGGKPDKYGNNVKVDGEIRGKFGIAAIPVVAKSIEDWELEAFQVHQEQKTVTLQPEEFSEDDEDGSLVMK